MEVQHFGHLASAVAGRRLLVEGNPQPLAYIDGETISVPLEDPEATLVAVVCQSLLVGAGSLAPALVRDLARRPSAARRYLGLEVARAVSSLDACLPRSVVARIRGAWEGPLATSAQESLDLALGREPVPDAPEAFGTILPRKLLRHPVTSGPSEPGEGKLNLHGKARAEEPDDEDEDEDTEVSQYLSRLMRMVPSGWREDSPLARILETATGMKRSATPGQSGEGIEVDMKGAVAAAPTGSRGVLVPQGQVLTEAPGTEVTGRLMYPEWEWQSRSYRPRWCHVTEFDPPANAGPTDVLRGICSDGDLRRRLGRLGLGYQRKGRQPDGSALDVSALVELAVSRAAGTSDDGHVYQARLRTARDLGVLVLLDASGSTHEQRSNGTTIWDQQRQVCARLVHTLEAVGDRVAAYGFNSRGRSIRFLRIKEFDGRFDHAAVARLESLEPSGFTRLGGAIRHGTHVVATNAGTSHLLLVLVSDGFPHDADYRGPHAESDTRRALDEAVACGVGCVCLSIGSSTAQPMLDRVWGNVTHVRLDTPQDLNRHVIPMFQSALRAARPARTGARPVSLSRR